MLQSVDEIRLARFILLECAISVSHLFDEIDSIGYNRNKLTSEHMRPIIDQMLAEIEGIDSSTEKSLSIVSSDASRYDTCT